MPEAAKPSLNVAFDPYGSNARTNTRGQDEHPNYTDGMDSQKAKTGGRISIQWRGKPKQPIALGLFGLSRVVSFKPAAQAIHSRSLAPSPVVSRPHPPPGLHLKIKPQYFHFTVMAVFLIVGAALFFAGQKALSGFFAMGAVVAAAHWKASKLGLIDR